MQDSTQAQALDMPNWWPLAAGVVVVLGASYVRFWSGAWSDLGGDYAPMVVAMAMFLAWRGRDALRTACAPVHAGPAWVLIGAGLLCYLLGVRLRFVPIEGFSHVPLIAGALWLVGGRALVRRMWAPLLFLLIAVPLPGSVLGAATGELKQLVSYAAVEILHAAGYPIARDGAILTVGPYQLFVAEACAGMNSIISLSAVGLLYLCMVPPLRRWHQAVSLASIIPIAVCGNILRIIILVLITYHLGDEAGQGFLHETAGMVMFGFALAAFFGLGSLLARSVPAEQRKGTVHA